MITLGLTDPVHPRRKVIYPIGQRLERRNDWSDDQHLTVDPLSECLSRTEPLSILKLTG